jgi:hypothetical protein
VEFATVSHGLFFPGGFMPGEEEDDRHSDPCDLGGEEGPHCTFLSMFKVLCAKFEDCTVILFFFKVLFVSCKSTVKI